MLKPLLGSTSYREELKEAHGGGGDTFLATQDATASQLMPVYSICTYGYCCTFINQQCTLATTWQDIYS